MVIVRSVSAVPLGIPRIRRLGPDPAVDDPAAPDRPDTAGLIDRYGRTATDLRVSLTDRCNLRCSYCMPADGLDWMPPDQALSDSELLRLIGIAVGHLGVREIRFTGGEPLLRPGLERLVEAVAALTPRPSISLTTNGIGLAGRSRRLAAAGLDRVNVSLDTIEPGTFRQITRRDRLAHVLAGLAAAKDAGMAPVKVNAVLLRNVNDHQAADLLDFCLDHDYQLRFIEQMPLDAQHGWDRRAMITAAEIEARLARRFDLVPSAQLRAGAPAELFEVTGRLTATGRPATVGIIASVTRPFCGACDRTRLTADGQVRTCLFATDESDLRGPLRAGADDNQLADRWRAAMWAKGPGHEVNDPDYRQPSRPMSAIGG